MVWHWSHRSLVPGHRYDIPTSNYFVCVVDVTTQCSALRRTLWELCLCALMGEAAIVSMAAAGLIWVAGTWRLMCVTDIASMNEQGGPPRRLLVPPPHLQPQIRHRVKLRWQRQLRPRRPPVHMWRLLLAAVLTAQRCTSHLLAVWLTWPAHRWWCLRTREPRPCLRLGSTAWHQPISSHISSLISSSLQPISSTRDQCHSISSLHQPWMLIVWTQAIPSPLRLRNRQWRCHQPTWPSSLIWALVSPIHSPIHSHSLTISPHLACLPISLTPSQWCQVKACRRPISRLPTWPSCLPLSSPYSLEWACPQTCTTHTCTCHPPGPHQWHNPWGLHPQACTHSPLPWV